MSAMPNQYTITMGKTIEKTAFYQVKTVFQSNNKTDPIRYVYQFNMKAVKQLSLESHLDFNMEIFTKCSELVPGQNLQLIINKKKTQNDKMRVYCYPYECRLNQYVKKRDIQEEQSISIMTDVVEAIYSVYKDQYICSNIRAENFVRVPVGKGKANEFRWKLQSVPFIQNQKVNQSSIDSPYTFKSSYQPPESYLNKNKLEQNQEIESALVWNIGCLWLEILYQGNVLNNHEIIKDFCIGNGSIGVFNVAKALGFNQKLKNNFKFLTSMLEYYPKKRKPLQDVFGHPIFGNTMHSHICKEFKSARIKSIDLSPSNSKNLKVPSLEYENLNDFIGNLIKIINQEKLQVLEQEKSAILKKLKSFNNSKLQSLQISDYQPKSIKKSGPVAQLLAEEKVVNSLSVEQIQKFLRPYKFYYDKTVFMGRCSQMLTAKLQQKLNLNNLTSVIMGLDNNSNDSYDLIFTFQHAIIYMRLIYLRNLLTNVDLNQNVFNIPSCTQNINNSKFDSTAVEWQVFNATALYDALKIFLTRKFDECERQFQFLVETQNNSGINLSPQCHQRVHTFYKKINYKKCPISEFQAHYQQILISVIHEIDEHCILKKGYKMQRADHLQKRQSIKNIALLELCIFIESPTLFSFQYREKLFKRFMIQNNEKDESFFHDPSINSRKEYLVDYVPEKDVKQIFSFRDYENFSKTAQYQTLSDHVTQLITRYRV